MKNKKLLTIGAVFLVVFVFLSGGFYFYSKNLTQDGKVVDLPKVLDNISTESTAIKEGKKLSNNQCEGEEKPKLGTLPMKYDDFKFIIPYGLTAGGHVTPIDHQYFSPTVFQSPRDTYNVYAMADAKIVDISPRTNDKGTEYRFVFSMSCKLFYYYDLVTSLTPELKTAMEEKQSGKSNKPMNIPIKEGQLVGKIGGQTLDFAVWDMDINLTGFVVPEHYEGESWKIHTADPLNYYTEDLKTKALSKYIRTAEPVSGKIDYDIDGKLVGNWFLEGSGGYSPKNMQGGQEGYWKGHLSIAYDNYDPTSIVVSVGDFNGEAKQFGVKGNVPDPAIVSVSSGIIKYELVQQDWADLQGNPWNRDTFVKGLKASNQNNTVGVVLAQMLEDRKVKFEVFPGKTASQVSGFTANAKIYER